MVSHRQSHSLDLPKVGRYLELSLQVVFTIIEGELIHLQGGKLCLGSQ